MILRRYVYISSARLDPLCQDDMVSQIMDHAVTANPVMQVTGAIIFDGSRFAQVLEGPEPEIVALAARIAADSRHSDVTFIEQRVVDHRLFAHFSMAYGGRSVFVERTISLALAEAGQRSSNGLRELVEMMHEFSR